MERGFRQPNGSWLVIEYDESRPIMRGDLYYCWTFAGEDFWPRLFVAEQDTKTDLITVRAHAASAKLRVEQR